jgi:hypothetical protein
MAYTSYDEFRVAFQIMLDGDDMQSQIQPNTLDLMISLGESIVHYGDESGLGPLRASSMETVLSELVATNAVALPEDCMELSIVWFDGQKPLDVVSEQDMRDRSKWVVGGPVRQCAQAGDSLIFLPAATDGATLLGRYYAKPPALKDGLHATFNRYPELYLYAALYSSSPFLGEDARIPVWQNFYRNLLRQANTQERMRAYNGSRIRQVAR